MDTKLEAEVLKTCESIGFADEEGQKYIADADWELCVKDLILYLRRDDEDHSIRRLLGRAQVLGRDLLPLLKHNNKDPKTWEVTLRLIANLTHPALLLYDEEVPKNKKYLNYYYQLEGHLRKCKAAFVDNDVWKVLAEKLKQLFEIEYDKRKDHHKLTIERILILIRNILHVPADPAEERRADDDTSLHDRILLILHMSGILGMLQYIAASDSSHEYSILILEIMSLMFREQTGEQLAKTQWTRNEEDKIRDERELIRMREKESVLKSIQLQKMPARHSRFGGTYVVKDMKAPSGHDLLTHKPIKSMSDVSLDDLKKRKKVASNRKPLADSEITRRSTIPVRIILKNFCASFVSKIYNRLMTTVKDYINRSRGEDNDETYYLWGLKFFMEFNRHHEFKMKNVSETISSHTFHYVQTLLDRYQGMMVTDKEKISFWSRRAHTALKAYQELLFTLLWMDKHGEDEQVKDKSASIKSNVFYLPEYRELLLSLLNTYEPVKYSKGYLRDLVETNHLFLKMLEDYSKESRRVVVKVKGKKKRSKKPKKKPQKKIVKAKAMTSEELEETWTKFLEDVENAVIGAPKGVSEDDGEGISSETSENVIPFDAASDIPIDDQKDTAVERVAAFLHTGKFKEAVILLRAAREVWSTDSDMFGELDVDQADEVELLRTIFTEKASTAKVLEARTALQNVGQNEEEEPAPVPREDVDEDEQERTAVIGGNSEDEEREKSEEDEEEEEEMRSNDTEQEFDFKGFVYKYAIAKVVCNYALLFQDWDTLKPLTLHCIVKMFHRFVFDMDYPALICQASLFLTFKKIMLVADHRSDLKEVKSFFIHFWPKFAKLCENKNMFVEILFWKTAREAQEIQDGYADLRSGGGTGKSKKSDWTKEEDTELQLLVELYQDSPEEVKKAQKLLDFIMERWTWRSRGKRAFQNRLVEKKLIDPAEIASKSNKRSRPPKTWSDEEISKLRELYEEHKYADDIMGSILPLMEIQRSKKSVVDKMIELELIRDKKEVKKRKGRSTYQSRSQVSDHSDSENEGERRSERERAAQSGSDSSGSDSDRDDANESSDDDGGDDPRSLGGSTGPYDDEKVCEAGRKLMAKGMEVAIRWAQKSLKNYLEDIIEDPDSDESVPLVPVNSECILAISDSDFKLFLKHLGISPPGLQETYWRIPSYFKKKDVELRIDAVEKVLSAPVSSSEVASSSKPTDGDAGNRSDAESDVASSIRSRNDDTRSAVSELSTSQPKKSSRILQADSDSDPELPDSDLSDSETESNLNQTLTSQTNKTPRSRVIQDESESESDSESKKTGKDDDDDNKSTTSSVSNVITPKAKSKSKRAILDDSDSDAGEREIEEMRTSDKEDAGSFVSDSSSVVKKVKKRKRVVLEEDSDDEGNTSETNQRSKKVSRALPDSDSD